MVSNWKDWQTKTLAWFDEGNSIRIVANNQGQAPTWRLTTVSAARQAVYNIAISGQNKSTQALRFIFIDQCVQQPQGGNLPLRILDQTQFMNKLCRIGILYRSSRQ